MSEQHVSWVEPWDEEAKGTCYIEAPESLIIEQQRARTDFDYSKLTDEEIIVEFCIVHWAYRGRVADYFKGAP